MRILAVGHQEDGFDLGIEPVVGQGHPELVLHVGESAQPAQDHLGPGSTNIVHGQSLERLDRDIRIRTDDVARHLDSLVHVEQRGLVEIDADADDQTLEKESAAADHIQMTQCERIECAREHGRAIGVGRLSHHGWIILGDAKDKCVVLKRRWRRVSGGSARVGQ